MLSQYGDNDTPTLFPIPTTDPDNAGSLVYRRISSDWLPLILGAIGELLLNEDNHSWGNLGELEEIFAKVRHVESQLMTEVELTMSDYVGKIETCAVATLPPNRLWCDGSTHARVDYPELYAALDSAFIVDADTFTVPDLRGRVPVGAGGQWAMGVNGGEDEHTLTIDEMPSHDHGAVPDLGYQFNFGYQPGGSPANVLSYHPLGRPTIPRGGSAAHNNMQPFLVVRYVIVASQ
jgi:microcystin-dependent protein